jgi:hypothetical protein
MNPKQVKAPPMKKVQIIIEKKFSITVQKEKNQ